MLARRRLLTFIQKLNPRYIPGWVHEDICRRLERFSREVEEGKSPRLMLLVPPRHGKACAVGTLVPTPDGFRRIETLRPGDQVFGRDGRPTRVVAVSPVWKNRELYEVVSDDGASVVVDAEHEWTVRLCRKRPAFKAKTTKYLAERSSPRNPALMTYSAVEFPEKELPIHPYVLGVWLGDGCSAHATISQGEQDYDFIRTEVERCGHLTSDRATVGTFGVAGIQPHLRDLGVLRTKHIPEIYRTASAEQRRALLQGLVDTDGHVAPDGQVEVCSVNEELARHTLMLVRSLGVKATMIQGDATLDGEFVSRKYRVMFYMAGAARLPRKASRCRDNLRTPQRFLTFKPAGRGDTVCIQVDAPDHQYLVGHGYLLTHNSEIASRMFPAWHLGRCPDHEFIACSYNVSLAMSFSRKVKETISDPVYEAIYDTRLHPDFQAAEEWAIKGHRGGYVAAGVGGGITGKGAHILTIDDPIKNAEEAQSADLREKLWEWYTSTAYTRLAPGGGVLVIQTWWHDDDLAGKLQAAMKADPEADAFEIVRYPAIAEHDEYLDPETDLIVDQPPTPDARPLRLKGEALHPARYDLRRLAQIRRTLPAQWWSALYQQNPVPDEGVYFTKDMFRRAPAPSKTDCYVSVTFDFAISEKQHNDYTVGVVSLLDGDDMLHFVDRVRFKSADADFIVKSIVSLCKKWHNPSIQLGLEDGQIYRALSGPLKREMARQRMYPSLVLLKPITDKQSRARTLQGRMQQGLVSFCDQADWYDQMRTELLRFPSGVHDDQVDAAAWNAIMVATRQPPRKQQARPMKSWKDRLSGAGEGTHMAA